MNFCTQRTVTWHCAIELASVKCTKLHSGSETDPILAGSPGAYTLNRAIDCFNPACLLCVRDNNLLSYPEITLVLRSCNVVQLYCGTAKALSNIDAPSSYSHWAYTAVGHVWLLRLTLYCNLYRRRTLKEQTRLRINALQSRDKWLVQYTSQSAFWNFTVTWLGQVSRVTKRLSFGYTS